MLGLMNTKEIGWKAWTLLAVIGGAGALGGSFYAGKWVGSSQPPTVIRVPPSRVPIPVGLEDMPSPRGDAQASPATGPNRSKRIPMPGSPEERSLGPAMKKTETNDS